MVLLPTHCPLALPWGSNPGQLHHMWDALTTELPSWSNGGIINSNTQGITEGSVGLGNNRWPCDIGLMSIGQGGNTLSMSYTTKPEAVST